MSEELMDVWDDNGLSALPSRTADAFTIRNARTRNRPLERAKNQFADSFIRYAVEPCPPEAESLVQGSSYVCHVRNCVRLTGDQRFDLRQQGLVFLLFGHKGNFSRRDELVCSHIEGC